jgi:hypothetical protein
VSGLAKGDLSSGPLNRVDQVVRKTLSRSAADATVRLDATVRPDATVRSLEERPASTTTLRRDDPTSCDPPPRGSQAGENPLLRTPSYVVGAGVDPATSHFSGARSTN